MRVVNSVVERRHTHILIGIFSLIYYNLSYARMAYCKYSTGQKTVFTRSAITRPKVNRFGWNLSQCGPNVGLALTDFGRDPRSSEGSFFQKNPQKLLTQFPGLANSGRHNSAMITDRRKFTAKWSSTGCLVSIFTIRINSESSLWDVRSVQETYLHKFLAIVDVVAAVRRYVNCSTFWLQQQGRRDLRP